VYELTGNAGLARFGEFLVGPPLKILLILAFTWLAPVCSGGRRAGSPGASGM
jgi:hypothetical protein